MTRHYEGLIQDLHTSLVQNDLSSNTAATLSLHRLAHNLRSLIRSMNGELPDDAEPSPPPDPSQAHDPSLLPSSSSSSSVPTPEELNSLLKTREDWAIEREHEIARLDSENEYLRRVLGIDRASAAANGWLDDESRELSFFHGRRHFATAPYRTSSPAGQLGVVRGNLPSFEAVAHMVGGSSNMGMGMGIGIGPAPGPGAGGPAPGPPPLPGTPGGGPVGMPGGSVIQPGMRGVQGRRTAMFGGRGRGGPPYYDGNQNGQERPWQMQGGFDLGR